MARLNSCCCQCLLVFCSIIFIVIGFIMTVVGHYSRPAWAQKPDDLCSECKAQRVEEQENLRNCRVSGVIFFVIGGILIISSVIYCHIRRSANEGQVLDAMEHSSTVITSTTETTTTTGISPGSKQTSNPQQYPDSNVQYACCGLPAVVAQVSPMETVSYSANSRQPWSLQQPQVDGDPPPAYDSIAVDDNANTGPQCATE